MIFKTKEDVQKYIAVNANFKISEIEPSYNQAVNEYIVPALSRSFINEVEAWANDYANASADQKLVVDGLRAALAPYTYFLYSFIGSVEVGAQGTQESSSSNNQPARQWVLYDFRKSLIRSGDVALDALLEVLENSFHAYDKEYDNTEAMIADQENQEIGKYYKVSFLADPEADIQVSYFKLTQKNGVMLDYEVSDLHKYPTWKNSEAYTKTIDLFFSTANQMREYCNVSGGRRTYLAMRPYIRRAERQMIKPLIGDDLFNQLKEELSGGNVSEDNKRLIEEYIRPALAPMSLMKAIPELSLETSDEGVKFKSFDNGITKQNMPVSEDKGNLLRSLDVDGNSALKALEGFLIKNANTYEAFKTSQSWLDFAAIVANPQLDFPDYNAKIVSV